MALIYSHGTQKPSDMTVPCWVCSGLISRRAKECPHCGHPDPVEESIKKFEERLLQEHKAAVERGEKRREFWLLQLVTWLGIAAIVGGGLLFLSFVSVN